MDTQTDDPAAIPPIIPDEALLEAGRVRSGIDTWADLTDESPGQAEAALSAATEHYPGVIQAYTDTCADVVPVLDAWENTGGLAHTSQDEVGAVIHAAFLKWLDLLGTTLENRNALAAVTPKEIIDQFWSVIDVFDAEAPQGRDPQHNELALTIFDGWVDATRDRLEAAGIHSIHRNTPGLSATYSVTFHETLTAGLDS